MRRPPATIVILAWNEWSATRACLDSLRPTLGAGDQVVVIDNGSTDQTPRGLQRYGWAEVVTNEENLGFAAGCNQGAALARHDVVVFLNNDTLPVGRWLDALVEPFADESVGATGARSNFVSGPQLVREVDYTTPRRADVIRFERAWRQRHQGQTSDADRLVGFCLAVRRSAFEAVGGFDEGFGLGGFEDDDLCARLRRAGHRLVIAHGAYVHHDGHRTFEGNGVDWFALQEDNGARFRQKHGHAADAGAVAGQIAVRPSGDVGAEPDATISACLIVRDEHEHLPACLASLAGVVDEVVIYDTGSTDDTVEIARASGAVVIEGYWDDDFGRARNAALEACTGTWVLQIDADEELVSSGDVRTELGGADALVMDIDNVGAGGEQGFAHAAVRLFRRERGHWTGKLHEHVTARPGESQLRVRDCSSIRLRHWGYSPEAFAAKAKLERNVRVARAEVEETGGRDGHAVIGLARALGAAGETDEAIECFEQALVLPLGDVDRRLVLRQGTSLLLEAGRFRAAMRWVERLRPVAADASIVRWLEGQALIGAGDAATGVALLSSLDTVEDGDGYRLPPATVRNVRAQVLADANRWDDVVECLLASGVPDVDDFPWSLAAAACAATGDDATRLADLVGEEDLVAVAGAVLAAGAEAADLVVEALWRRYPAHAALLAAAVRLAPALGVERALEWSARLRAAGLDRSCPLIALARDQRRTPTDRLRAAAVVAGAFDPDQAHELLVLLASSAPEDLFESLLVELDGIMPSLLPSFVELLASSPARCRSLSDVLAGLGATDEAAIVAELGEALAGGPATAPVVAPAADEPAPAAGAPDDGLPGVFVLGMHRSGTSAVTRVVNLLGVRCADESDLMPAHADQNAKGFWESTSLSQHNDELLESLGGSWSAPPADPTDATVASLVADRGATGREAFERVHGPGGGWVWKDPRNCLTFPYWASVLPVEPVIVVPFRDPLEVCHSLEIRDGFTKAHALALWERYTRSALRAATGKPTLVCSYADLLADPAEWCAEAGAFLAAHGLTVDVDGAMDAVVEFLDTDLRHAVSTAHDLDDDDDLTPSQRALWQRLQSLQGAHPSLDADPLGSESFWVEPLLGALRDRTAGDAVEPTVAADVPSSTPPCSIIIPLFNKVEYTQRCLESLIETTDPELFELVLVDNGSTDGTEALLRCIEGDVVIIRNEVNLGFAVACNQGAVAARGEHLLFLNNDTEAHPGWLPPLLDALDADPHTAAAGSRLLFPDGTVQHAGVHVAEDRRPGQPPVLPFHRLYRAPAEHPEVMRPAQMSVLTGASLLVRRSAFFDVGGFDEGFWNGYEDVDLCFKLRERGDRLAYVPASCLVHHESVSGPERFTSTEANVTRLVERWWGRVPADVVIDPAGGKSLDPKAALRPIGPPVRRPVPAPTSPQPSGALRTAASQTP